MSEEDEEKETQKQELKIVSMKNYWMFSTIILLVLLIVLLVIRSGSDISVNDAGQKLLDFANSQGMQNIKLVKTNDFGSTYEIILSLDGQEFPVYVTKDGKYIAAQLIPLTQQNTPTNSATQIQSIPELDKPKVELYVMSFCPYGNRAENTMRPVYNLLKDYIDFNVYFIVSVSGSSVKSLHGQAEVDEDMREACVLKNNGIDKWWMFATYVNDNCGSSSDLLCWKDAAKIAGISESSITSCVSSDGVNLMKGNAVASEAANANSSPTLIINGIESGSVYQYGDSDAYKQAICSAFTNSPESCNQLLGGAVGQSGPSGSCS